MLVNCVAERKHQHFPYSHGHVSDIMLRYDGFHQAALVLVRWAGAHCSRWLRFVINFHITHQKGRHIGVHATAIKKNAKRVYTLGMVGHRFKKRLAFMMRWCRNMVKKEHCL